VIYYYIGLANAELEEELPSAGFFDLEGKMVEVR
jgi:hypothetical protein